MTENLIEWKKVSFTEYLNKDGSIVQTVGFAIHGEVLMFLNRPIENGYIRVASVSFADGELYFVPFDSLTFNESIE